VTVQLHMRRELGELPDLIVPEGVELRSMTPDDLEAWRSLLAGNGELGEWSLDRARALFTPGSPMPLEGSFLATVGGRPAATAQLHLHDGGDPYAPVPELGWVAALPAFQGHRLGRLVCLAVLRHAAGLGHRRVFLRTDDHRLPAIRTYLRLGFEPWMYDPTAPERWRALLRNWPDLEQAVNAAF
jgi:mycothiol synthase